MMSLPPSAANGADLSGPRICVDPFQDFPYYVSSRPHYRLLLSCSFFAQAAGVLLEKVSCMHATLQFAGSTEKFPTKVTNSNAFRLGRQHRGGKWPPIDNSEEQRF